MECQWDGAFCVTKCVTRRKGLLHTVTTLRIIARLCDVPCVPVYYFPSGVYWIEHRLSEWLFIVGCQMAGELCVMTIAWHWTGGWLGLCYQSICTSHIGLFLPYGIYTAMGLVWFVLCCLMTPALSKDIRCQVWPYFFLNLQITRSDIKSRIKWAVSLVIA